jgi:CRISPR/Cas system-associated exonuclease Cas4 (RecB family)
MSITIDACLQCAREGALPGCHQTAPVIAGIVRGLRPDSFGLTVTTLISCVRKTRLMREVPYWLKPSESYWAYRGTLMHGVAALYAAEADQIIAEQRFAMLVETLDGRLVEVTGQPDLVLLDQARILDFKTTKSVPTGWRSYMCPETEQVISEGPYALRRRFIVCPYCRLGQHEVKAIEVISEPRAKAQHVLQLSLYRLLLHRHGIEVTAGEIVYQDMDTQRRIPVDLMSLADAERYLRERVTLATQLELPSVLTDEEELWQCDYCPVRDECERQHGGRVGKAAHLKSIPSMEEV